MGYTIRNVGKVKVLSLSGSLDRYTSIPVRRWFEEISEDGPTCLVVNMEGLYNVDSSGLSILVTFLNRSRRLNGDLRLCCLPQQIRMIFELTRLDKAFEIYATEEDAIQAFSSQGLFS